MKTTKDQQDLMNNMREFLNVLSPQLDKTAADKSAYFMQIATELVSVASDLDQADHIDLADSIDRVVIDLNALPK